MWLCRLRIPTTCQPRKAGGVVWSKPRGQRTRSPGISWDGRWTSQLKQKEKVNTHIGEDLFYKFTSSIANLSQKCPHRHPEIMSYQWSVHPLARSDWCREPIITRQTDLFGPPFAPLPRDFSQIRDTEGYWPNPFFTSSLSPRLQLLS